MFMQKYGYPKTVYIASVVIFLIPKTKCQLQRNIFTTMKPSNEKKGKKGVS